MRLFLDDKRSPPDNSWILCENPSICIDMLGLGITVDELSLDYTMSDVRRHGTGLVVVEWMQEQVKSSNYKVPAIITIHSTSKQGKPLLEEAVSELRQLEKERDDAIMVG